jgi:hypothetical protein
MSHQFSFFILFIYHDPLCFVQIWCSFKEEGQGTDYQEEKTRSREQDEHKEQSATKTAKDHKEAPTLFGLSWCCISVE